MCHPARALCPGGGAPDRVLAIRSAFVAPTGKLLISADYSQLELRLMAHFSRDDALVASLGADQADPFRVLAARWRGGGGGGGGDAARRSRLNTSGLPCLLKLESSRFTNS